ncbi:RDD family protein [candidate division WWE3 bacterium]|nr:RDD family protein [candidate division WWE3 bacterium]
MNAGFLIRALAYLLDKLLGLILLLSIILIYSYFVTLEDGMEFIKIFGNITTIVISLLLLATLINLIYYTYFLSRFGGTLGKLLLGIQVFDKETGRFLDTKKAFFRSFAGYSFSGQFMGLGFLAINKKRNNLAWHDELFNTEVKAVGSVWPGVILTLLFLAINAFVVIPVIFSLVSKTFSAFGTPSL